jgi:diguanylate cyclase (GGDEF)-like protein
MKRNASHSMAERKVFPMGRRKPSPRGHSKEKLSSSLLSQDKELARIWREVNELAKRLKSDSPDPQALSDVLQRAMLCAIKQTFLDRELRSLALTDDLTGLYNRRAFLALATQQLKVARRKSQKLLLFFADVNFLKEINDSYGHGEGDSAIVRVANVLEQSFRSSDVIARIGGDEFAVLALEASGQSEQLILDRLEKGISQLNATGSRYKLSLSVGISRFDPQCPVSLEDLIAKADEAMYENKRRPCEPLNAQSSSIG